MKEKERSRIRVIQIDNLRFCRFRRKDKFLNALIMEFFEVMKGVDKRIDEGVLGCFTHVERNENNRIVKRVYVGECARWLWKRWKDCLKKKFGCLASKENGLS